MPVVNSDLFLIAQNQEDQRQTIGWDGQSNLNNYGYLTSTSILEFSHLCSYNNLFDNSSFTWYMKLLSLFLLIVLKDEALQTGSSLTVKIDSLVGARPGKPESWQKGRDNEEWNESVDFGTKTHSFIINVNLMCHCNVPVISQKTWYMIKFSE